MKPELQKTILEKWALAPDDVGLKNNLIRLIQEGKVQEGAVSRPSGLAFDDYMAKLDRLKNELVSERWDHARTKRRLETAYEDADKAREQRMASMAAQAKGRAAKAPAEKATRNYWHPDNRVEIWKASVAASFEQRTCDHDDDGRRISWNVRMAALEYFRIHLFHFVEVDSSTLRWLTLVFNGEPDMTEPLDCLTGSKRAGPPPVDWVKVRDKLQKVAE